MKLSGIFGILFAVSIVFIPGTSWSAGSDFQFVPVESGQVFLKQGDKILLKSPDEGLWSVALGWKDSEPADWRHVRPSDRQQVHDWTILSGSLSLPSVEGTLSFRDAYRFENGRVRCTRRFEYEGKRSLEHVTLSVRWQMAGKDLAPFLPGILYYGNPSGAVNTPKSVPVWTGKKGEIALFEDHRYPMPFACFEDQSDLRAAAIYTVPSPVVRGNVPDQWWSCGVRQIEADCGEFDLYSGFIGYNGKPSVAKARQSQPMDYPPTTMTLLPGTIIEKTFYLDAWNITAPGTGFQHPVQVSIEMNAPYYADDLPARSEIVRDKLEFVPSRWIQGEGYAGFHHAPKERPLQIVMGWTGQADAPGFVLPVLTDDFLSLAKSDKEKQKQKAWLHDTVQRSLDFLTTSPVTNEGFSVRYDVAKRQWLGHGDHVSMGQGMYDIAMAIKVARSGKYGTWKTQRWEHFLRSVCDVHAKRILRDDWHSRSTAEAFYIAPLILSSSLFDCDEYRRAAVKAADYFASRHLSMKEPYWGGTLDARCEDKEGAWAAFQGFLTMYDVTGEKKYLDWAKHACDVCLSYLVVWDIPLPPGRLADHQFKTRGWTVVSVQNQHLDVYGVIFAPEVERLGKLLGIDAYVKASEVMFRSCGQLIDPFGSQGEQIQQTNFAQHGDMSDVLRLRGGYAERWTVFWITTHFLVSEAKRRVMNE